MIDMKKEIEKLYIKLQKESGFKIGDTVKVIRDAECFESGWQHVWIMDETVGKTYKIESIHEYEGIQLENGYSYPFFVLEKVENVIYHVGQKFYHGSEKYLLASVGNRLVNLINTETGYRINVDGLKVSNTRKITESEMIQLVDEYDFSWSKFELVE